MLLQFTQEKGEIYFSERLGIDFVEKHFHILEKDFERTLSQAETQELRIIRMIGDFQLYHTVLRRLSWLEFSSAGLFYGIKLNLIGQRTFSVQKRVSK